VTCEITTVTLVSNIINNINSIVQASKTSQIDPHSAN